MVLPEDLRVIAAMGALVGQPAPLVVVSGLEEVDCLVSGAVHQTVFLSDAPRPKTGGLEETRLKYGEPFRLSLRPASLSAKRLLSQV